VLVYVLVYSLSLVPIYVHHFVVCYDPFFVQIYVNVYYPTFLPIYVHDFVNSYDGVYVAVFVDANDVVFVTPHIHQRLFIQDTEHNIDATPSGDLSSWKRQRKGATRTAEGSIVIDRLPPRCD